MNLLEVFVFTNGSSLLDYTMQSIESQTIRRKVTVLRDMSMIDACNQCIERCKSRFFMKVDDDMFLHPQCLSFYESRVSRMSNHAFFAANLLEFWRKKPSIVYCLKAYDRKIARKIGFKADKFGRVDRTFLAKAKLRRQAPVIDKKSVVAVHVLRSLLEQKQYQKIWTGLSKGRVSKRIFKTDIPAAEQFLKIESLAEWNRKNSTGFYSYLNGLLKINTQIV